ncbi:replication protein A 70 kDa DNA-binding subunit B-like isoform X2 [Bidens hawaiensis]|uniref:replication protein A 70 kDa DNA-binding subunit B-like isoform X2 n=1 Tax=Bidens hawaiensis TaxID=980011 RepID=UPI004049611E
MPGVDWYYDACKTCNKKVKTVYVVSDPVDASDKVEPKQIIRCPNDACNKRSVSTIPRFKIPLRLQDNTGVASLTVFDREARKMLKKCARELLDSFLEDGLSMIPPELTHLVGKKYAFKIDITDYNITNNYNTFTIKKFTDDYSIISKLESKFEVGQVDLS